MADPHRVLNVHGGHGLPDILQLFLAESVDFFVITKDSAAAAISLIRTENSDAIISGYQMPELEWTIT